MKTQLKINIIALLLAFPLSLYAQDNVEAVKKLDREKTELAKLESELVEKTKAAELAGQKAQSSANANKEAAVKLKNNVKDENLSKAASEAARSAVRDSKEAGTANLRLTNLQKAVQEKRNKITEAEKQLSIVAEPATAVVASIPVAGTPVVGTVSEKSSQASDLVPAPVNDIVLRTSTDQVSAALPTKSVANTGLSPATLPEKIVESTYKSYPQQPGQPSIIINNIIVPSDYSRLPVQGNQMGNVELSDKEEYEDYKAWLRLKKAGKLGDYRSSNLDHSRSVSSAERKGDENTDTKPDVKGGSGFAGKLRELPARNSGLWIIPVAGVHASNFKTDFTDSDAEGRVGWNAGIDFRIRAKRFFVQPGVHYFNSSIDLTSKDSLSNAPLLSGPRLHSIKVPVLLGVYLTRANSGFFKLNVKAGASGNYLLAVDKNDSKEFEKDNLETYTYGLNAGLGLEFGLLTLDLSHEWGISSVLKDSNAKNNLLRVTLGFKL